MILAHIYMIQGDIVTAERCVNESVFEFRESGLKGRLTEALLLRADIATSASNLARARGDLDDLENMTTDLHDLNGSVFVCVCVCVCVCVRVLFFVCVKETERDYGKYFVCMYTFIPLRLHVFKCVCTYIYDE
jgi:hypothetical protein